MLELRVGAVPSAQGLPAVSPLLVLAWWQAKAQPPVASLRGQGLHLGDAGLGRRQRHRGRVVEQDVKVDVGRDLRARLRDARTGNALTPSTWAKIVLTEVE